MEQEYKIILQLKQWANRDPNIRAIILTSSRAAKNRQPDFLSDYDVEVFVKDTDPFIKKETWINNFGEIMTRWPAQPRATDDENWITQLVLYKHGVRIDFQITSMGPQVSANLSSGFEVIVDKDGIASDIPEPSFPYESIQQPSSADFESRMTAFWWDIVYVAKGLYRRELNYAKAMLDSTIRFEKLLPLLNWHIGITYGWNVDTGIYGRWLEKYLDAEIMQLYQKTFADSDFEKNWSALYATIGLFQKISITVTEYFGFHYPHETDRMVTAYIQNIENEYRKSFQ